MTTVKLNDTKYMRESYPYLFEDPEEGSRFELDVNWDGTVDVYAVFPQYVEKALRDHYKAQADRTGSAAYAQRATRIHQWSGAGFTLTPKQARKLAKAIKKAAETAESRD